MGTLVVRPGALGDSVLTVPLLQTVRSLYPSSGITFWGSDVCKDIMPNYVKFERFDSPGRVWLFQESDNPRVEDLDDYERAYLIINSPDRLTSNLKKAGVRIVSHVSSIPEPGMHIVEHIHAGLGLPTPERSAALKHLASSGKTPLVWLHPGSGGKDKCAPMELFISLVENILDWKGWNFAVTAGEEDAFLFDHPQWESLVNLPRVRLIKGRPLPEVCRELCGASIFLGNDSGVAHVAAGLGVPSAIFFLKTDPTQWIPWAPGDKVKAIDCRRSFPTPGNCLSLVKSILES
jgi:heptosyltransferase III